MTRHNDDLNWFFAIIFGVIILIAIGIAFAAQFALSGYVTIREKFVDSERRNYWLALAIGLTFFFMVSFVILLRFASRG